MHIYLLLEKCFLNDRKLQEEQHGGRAIRTAASQITAFSISGILTFDSSVSFLGSYNTLKRPGVQIIIFRY